MFSKSKLLFLAAFWFVNVQAMWIEYELAGFDNSKEGVLVTDLKSKRIDKTTFVLNGNITFREDFSNCYKAEVKLYHSAKGNNQYVLTPYKVPKDDLCNIIDGIFRKTVAPSLESSSNLPKAEEKESLCEKYKKGTYTIHQYPLEKSIVPKILQNGLYKGEILIYKMDSDIVSKIFVYVKLY